MLWRPVIMWIIKVQALSISNWRSLSWILVGSKLNFSLATVTNGFLDPKVPTQRHIGCNKILRNLRLQQKMVSLFWVYPSPTIPIIYMPGTPEKIDIGHKKKILMIHRKLLHQRQFFPRLPCSIFNLCFSWFGNLFSIAALSIPWTSTHRASLLQQRTLENPSTRVFQLLLNRGSESQGIWESTWRPKTAPKKIFI